ncbi:DUF1801 domain-containing protein [Sorangium sp. So ce854]|uniref:DUF1801 domain-containing protein n=1 Tax=Sorangium sp. So ce854 TaxID=3133322 RepID=UPI003F61FEB8
MRRTDEKPSKPRAKTRKGPPAGGALQGAPGKAVAPLDPGSPQTHPAVIAFLRELEHPLKQEIEALRRIILAVSPEIREEIKWNAPSFRTTEHFATFNLRTKDRVRLILHMGAKVKGTATMGVEIEDPAGLLEWLAKDRCLVTFGDEGEIREKRAGLETILRAWIRLM